METSSGWNNKEKKIDAIDSRGGRKQGKTMEEMRTMTENRKVWKEWA